MSWLCVGPCRGIEQYFVWKAGVAYQFVTLSRQQIVQLLCPSVRLGLGAVGLANAVRLGWERVGGWLACRGRASRSRDRHPGTTEVAMSRLGNMAILCRILG